jgi:hypothetical protein
LGNSPSKIKMAESSLSDDDFLNFAFCVLTFKFLYEHLIRRFRFFGIYIAEYPSAAGGAHGLPGVAVSDKPVMMDVTLFLRDAANDNGSLWSAERVIVNFD